MKPSFLSSLFASYLIALLILLPLNTVFAVVTDTGSLISGDSDSRDQESEEERDQREAEESAAEVSAAAEAAGVNVSVGAVYGSEPSGSEVTVNGISMSKDSAMEAISAISEANKIGGESFVNTDATLQQYANQSCSNCVVGTLSGQIGTAQEVAMAEIKAKNDQNVLQGIIGNNFDDYLYNTALPGVSSLDDALGVISGKPALSGAGVVSVPTNSNQPATNQTYFADTYLQTNELTPTLEDVTSFNSEKDTLIYDSKKGTLTNPITGKTYDSSLSNYSVQLSSAAVQNPNGDIYIVNKTSTPNTATDDDKIIMVLDNQSGAATYYNTDDKSITPDYQFDLDSYLRQNTSTNSNSTPNSYPLDIMSAMNWNGSVYGQYALVDDGKGGYKVLDATAGTLSSWAVTGQFDFGQVTAKLAADALAHGVVINDINEAIGLMFSGELSPNARLAISKAAADGDFSDLDPKYVEEAGAVLAGMVGLSHYWGVSFSELLMQKAQVTSISENGSAYNNLKNDGKAAMSAFADALTSGKLVDTFGLDTVAPVALANHTYAQGAVSNWQNNLIGETFGPDNWWTRVGYLPSEVFTSKHFNDFFVDQREPDISQYGLLQDDHLYTLVTQTPKTSSDIYSSIINGTFDSLTNIHVGDLYQSIIDGTFNKLSEANGGRPITVSQAINYTTTQEIEEGEVGLYTDTNSLTPTIKDVTDLASELANKSVLQVDPATGRVTSLSTGKTYDSSLLPEQGLAIATAATNHVESDTNTYVNVLGYDRNKGTADVLIAVQDKQDNHVTYYDNTGDRATNLITLENHNTRDLGITDLLAAQLNYAAIKNGVRVGVTSGGQMSVAEAKDLGATCTSDGTCTLPNKEKVHVGSDRHDHGGAADLVLYDPTGKMLNMTNPADQAIMKQFLIDSVAAGATGIGAGVDYMKAYTMHVGGGAEAAWGAGGKSANAPQWVADAFRQGIAARADFDPAELNNPQPIRTATNNQSTNNNQPTANNGSVVDQVSGQIFGDLGTAVGGIISVLGSIPNFNNQDNNTDHTSNPNNTNPTPTPNTGENTDNGLWGTIGNFLGIGGGDKSQTTGNQPEENQGGFFGINIDFGGMVNNVIDNMSTWDKIKIGLSMMFGGSGGGNAGTPNKSLNSSSGGGSSDNSSSNNNNNFVCPPASQITPEWLNSITDPVLKDNLINCLIKYGQSGTAIIPTLSSSWQKFIGLFSSKNKSINETKQLVENNEKINETINNTAVVKITINDQAGAVILSRPDWDNVITDESMDIDTRAYLIQSLREVPIVFGDNGEIIYSNGVFSPAVGTNTIEDNVNYTYIVEYIDQNGQKVPSAATNNNANNNFIGDALRSIVGGTSAFDLENVTSISYQLTDPNKKIAGDEYYKYELTLNNGRSRSITVPQFSSFQTMSERFNQIGYTGDPISLVAIAVEKPVATPGLISRLLSSGMALFGNFVDSLNSNNADAPTNTLLPEVSKRLTSSDIQSVFIYPNSSLSCPAVEGYSVGFMYTAIIANPVNSNQLLKITDGRCGSRDPLLMAEETAKHLNEAYGIKDVTFDNLKSKITFRNDQVIFVPGTSNIPLNKTDQTPSVPEETEDHTDQTPTLPTDETGKTPNLTNEITFEVKAVAGNEVLVDWTDADKITISPDVQLYFRWDGTAYQQCLPFLNDDGQYSLTSSNRAMLTGNTESEQYNVRERSSVYKIECGGQRNNEFGVDNRQIEVIIK